MGEFKGDQSVEATWQALKGNPEAVLIDVRSKAEWTFVGIPDVSSLHRELIQIEWQSFPGMLRNESFLDELLAKVSSRQQPLYFICRSGVRSRFAAELAAEHGFATYNVAAGFEGNLDDHSQRGFKDGWKHAGLPWKQT